MDGAIVLHPDTPDCEVKLTITLNTLLSPTVVRRIKLKLNNADQRTFCQP